MIVGMDTRTRAFHWYASEPVGKLGQRGTYGWATGVGEADEARRELLWQAVAFFQDLPAGAHVFVEEPLSLQNGLTTRRLNMAAAAIWCAFQFADPDAYWFWVDQSTWKSKVLGRVRPPKEFAGRSKATRTKDWIRETVRCLPEFGHELLPESEPDLYDAWAIMRYGVAALQTNKEMGSSKSERSS